MIRFIHEITDENIGGKARGLKILSDLGLSVPDAFVIIHPDIHILDDPSLEKSIVRLGKGPKAVRSSAVSEDGISASFAGQFETFLHLNNYSEIKDAIVKCIEATRSHRVREYVTNLSEDADLRISVILQNMVNAKVAGVVFSADPVTGRRDQVVINAVKGHGEDLVSGVKDAIHYKIFRSGSNINDQVKKQGDLLSTEQITEILEASKKAEQHLGYPVDMEWAIDQEGALQWLQVRPVTTLPEVHYNELDTVKGHSNDTWTLGNIGEMMPGVVTPLTYSVSFHAVDYGMTVWAEAAGAYSLKKYEGFRYIQMFYNRLFINMTNMMDYPRNVWMNKAENVQFAVIGKVIEIPDFPYTSNFPMRVAHFIKQMISLSWTKKNVKRLIDLAKNYRISETGNIESDYQALDEAREVLKEAFGHHIIASSQSGTLYSAMMGILTSNKRLPTSEDHHIATLLLTDIPNIESADAVQSLERFAMLIQAEKRFAGIFVSASPEEALRLLVQDSPPEVSRAYKAFLERHGHRCVREAELHEKPWEENPLQLVQMLQTRVKAGGREHLHATPKKVQEILAGIKPFQRIIIKSFLNNARIAVSRREITKSASIKVLHRLRTAWQHFAEVLIKEGLLDDSDQVYYLTHEEIGKLIKDYSPAWRAKANKRRELLPQTAALQFTEVCHGIPEPLEEQEEIEILDGQLKGIPVSSGVVEARVRIVNTMDDAAQLQSGEIMVASFTDIGWTPYFSIVSGLITEIGSPLSHGAVVAREYGIPAVVGAKGAKKFLKTGDVVKLNGDKGIVEIITN
ncbi:MAG: PEP-utilizing enzyme [Bacteroidetes bacterium]|nr:PEP-utilizing enzyme [Bacteroidota bacterium]